MVIWNEIKGLLGGLGAPVGSGRESRPEDVVKVKQGMRELGRYPRLQAEPSGVLDRELDRAIRNYQADRKLKQDGWLAPQGETAREMGRDLGLLKLASSSLSSEDAAAFYTEMTPGDAERSLRAHTSTFRGLASIGRRWGLGDLGFSHAAANLEHYLGASGKPKRITSAEVEAEPALRNAERANLTKFEAFTLTGTTGNKKLNELLKNLADGESRIDLEDNFEAKMSLWDHLRQPGTYFALGRTGVRSDLKAKVKRVGDQIGLEGWVTHRLDNRGKEENAQGRFGDTIDFNPGQPGHAEAEILEQHGRATPYDIDYTRRQPVTATLRRGRDGSLTVERAIWGESR